MSLLCVCVCVILLCVCSGGQVDRRALHVALAGRQEPHFQGPHSGVVGGEQSAVHCAEWQPASDAVHGQTKEHS